MNQNTQIITVTPQSTTAYRVDVLNDQGQVVSSAHTTVCVTTPSGPQMQLTVDVQGPGAVTIEQQAGAPKCSSQCSAQFEPGTKVTLSAEGIGLMTQFLGWSGCMPAPGVNNPSNAITVVMDQNVTCTATFVDCSQPSTPVASFNVSQTADGNNVMLSFDASASTGTVQEYQWTLPPAVNGLAGAGCTPTSCTLHTSSPVITELVSGSGGCFAASLRVVDACGRVSQPVVQHVPHAANCM